MPDKSPLISARNTGTPFLEKDSANFCKETVFPVPVAPVIHPWRLDMLVKRISSLYPLCSSVTPKMIWLSINFLRLVSFRKFSQACNKTENQGSKSRSRQILSNLLILRKLSQTQNIFLCYSSFSLLNSSAPVAQLDRVPGYEPGGRGFDSCLARH